MRPEDFHYEFIQNVWDKSYQQSNEQVDRGVKRRAYHPFFEIHTISMYELAYPLMNIMKKITNGKFNF
jgi:hypothetical protein